MSAQSIILGVLADLELSLKEKKSVVKDVLDTLQSVERNDELPGVPSTSDPDRPGKVE